jgi:F-type H+-transporting ATPase subunit delta
MRVQLLSKRYAQALFDLAIELKQLEKVEKDMLLIGKVLRENRELRVVLANAVLDNYKKVRVLNKIFDGKIEVLTLKFLQLITGKNRVAYLEPVCISFEEIYKKYKNIMPITLTMAYKADKKIVNAILEKLKTVTDKTLEVTEKVDEDLIGGFKLDFEDFQYDDSIKVQLKRLANEFSDNQYVSKI